MGSSASPLFATPGLLNNNVTLSYVALAHSHGPVAISLEACTRLVTFVVDKSRFYDVWGSAFNVSGLESSSVTNTIFEKSGGLSNGVAIVKLSWVALGYFGTFFSTSFDYR